MNVSHQIYNSKLTDFVLIKVLNAPPQYYGKINR